MGLSQRDYEELLQTIEEMHERALSGALITEAPTVLSKLIPCEYCAIFDAAVGPTPQSFRLAGTWENTPVVMSLIWRHYELARRTSELVAGRNQSPAPLEEFGLTPTESQVARWISEGKGNRDIAVILGAKVRTVEKHVERILAKLGVENRTEAALVMRDALIAKRPLRQEV